MNISNYQVAVPTVGPLLESMNKSARGLFTVSSIDQTDSKGKRTKTAMEKILELADKGVMTQTESALPAGTIFAIKDLIPAKVKSTGSTVENETLLALIEIYNADGTVSGERLISSRKLIDVPPTVESLNPAKWDETAISRIQSHWDGLKKDSFKFDNLQEAGSARLSRLVGAGKVRVTEQTLVVRQNPMNPDQPFRSTYNRYEAA